VVVVVVVVVVTAGPGSLRLTPRSSIAWAQHNPSRSQSNSLSRRIRDSERYENSMMDAVF
jgi:hypothetical protein